jgi:hypothetical protein
MTRAGECRGVMRDAMEPDFRVSAGSRRKYVHAGLGHHDVEHYVGFFIGKASALSIRPGVML